MFGKRSRPVHRLEPVGPVIDDAEVASSMARLGDAFVAGLATDGYRLSYALDDVYALDSAVDRYLATLPGYDARRGYAFSLGAFLGELLVRAYGGHWTRDAVSGQPGVRVPSGQIMLPMEETARRLEVGMSHALAAYFDTCVDRRAPHATAV